MARESVRAAGNHQLRAKLLRLVISPGGELLPGDAGGESEIVFNLRTGGGLATRRLGLDDQHIEPFGSRIDSCGETRRPSADDDNVADVRLINVFVEAETVGNLLIGGIAKHVLTAANEHRDIRHGDMKLVEHLLR